MISRRFAAIAALAAGLLLTATPVAAHPLGNATINRATAVTIGLDRISIVHVIDMAEIPAYVAILEADLDGNGEIGVDERMAYAADACTAAVSTLRLRIDDRPIVLETSALPELTFPPGVGGLETLRLLCTFSGDGPIDGETHLLSVSDSAEDERRGWREVTVVGAEGITIVTSDVPAVSPSNMLVAYPEDLLETPTDVSTGTSTYRSTTAGSSNVAGEGSTGPAHAVAGPSDALVDLLDGGAAPWSWLLAVVVAAGLGAAHAVSPGHGKALIAAYVIGSRGSMRRAAGLGLTVAASHTIGVFVLGAIVLSATELLVPDRVTGWLSVASGILVVGLGATVARRTWRARHRDETEGHPHPHRHGHPHDHLDEDAPPEAREFLALGLVGGMVPSTSALLVLLVAVATGRLAEGLVLILAFGVGMAVVLGGLAAVTALARNGLTGAAERPGASGLRRLAGAAPLASALVIIVVGVVTTVGALGSL